MTSKAAHDAWSVGQNYEHYMGRWSRKIATDASPDFVGHAGGTIDDPRVTFKTADGQDLPVADATVDVVTSALVMNFVPDKTASLKEMQRVLRPGGLLTFYVWDYPGGGMGFIDAFWKAAAAVDPKAEKLDEAHRFPFCTEAGLRAICAEAGLSGAGISAIEIVTDFPDFETFWKPSQWEPDRHRGIVPAWHLSTGKR